MKTVIEFKDGHSETVEDAAPSFGDGDNEMTVYCIDADMGILTDDVPLSLIARVIFEND